MKKAVIQVGSSQYLVKEGDVLNVHLLSTDKKTVSYPSVLTIDGDNTSVGSSHKGTVELSIEAPVVKADKVTAIRYKAKKRVMKVRGHKQPLTSVKVTKIS